MRRRKFIALLGATSVYGPLAARAQRSAMPVIGFLNSGSPAARAPHVDAFRKGLAEAGFVEGKNVRIEYRWAEGQYDRLPALATELVRLRVDVIAPTGSLMPAQAAKAATSKIPIVFEGGGGDPVQLGLVASFNRPGGNVTGVTNMGGPLEPKRLELLHDLIPSAKKIGVLVNPRFFADTIVPDLRAAARTLGQEIEMVSASTVPEIDAAFETLARLQVNGVHVAADVMIQDERNRVVALAARYSIPATYVFREFTEAGGLMSYGVNLPGMYRQAGVYTGRVLKGERPADIPVAGPAKFELVINLKTAKALGLTVPPTFLARADEVIE